MSESVSNRRRISEGLLEEIESFEGKDFSEKLLRWKNSSDGLSEELEKTVDALKSIGEGESVSVDELREKHGLDSSSGGHEDSLSVDDVEDAVSRALERDLPELLRREVRSP